jgi:hypothetical protein
MSKTTKDSVPGTDAKLIPEGTAATDAASAAGAAHGTHDASSKRPIWSAKTNRVESAVWMREQDGRVSFSVAVFREYFDRKEKSMKRHFYYDGEQDLDDLISIVHQAKDYILSKKGLVVDTPDED